MTSPVDQAPAKKTPAKKSAATKKELPVTEHLLGDRLKELETKVETLSSLMAKLLAQQAAPAIQAQLESQIAEALNGGGEPQLPVS